MDSSDSIAYDTYVENGGEGVTGRLFKFCITWNDLPVPNSGQRAKLAKASSRFAAAIQRNIQQPNLVTITSSVSLTVHASITDDLAAEPESAVH